MSETVLVGTFKHETNTFSPTVTDRSAFRERWEYFGEEIPANFAGTNTPMGGFLGAADDLEVIYTVAANAMPGGRVTGDAYAFYTDRIVDAVAEHAGRLDGVFLSLHGAMAPEGMDDGEGPLLSRIRERVDVPVVATLDPHTNLSAEAARESDVLVAYETYPHVDQGERGSDAHDLLSGLMDGALDPVVHVERPPLLPDFSRMNTREGPMTRVTERARGLEEREGVLKVNVLFGFNHADTPVTGMAIAAYADGDPDLARTAAREVAAEAWAARDDLVGEYPTPREAVEAARDRARGDGNEGPTLLIDVGDNPGGGGVEDRVDVLRELLDAGVDEAGVALVWDPDAVAECVDAGVGETVSLSLGCHTPDDYFECEPLAVEGYVKAISDGEFVNRGPKDTGVRQFLGRTVRLQVGEDRGIDVIVTEHRLSPNDAEVWRHVGIPPERRSLLVLKTVNHFRADYEPFAGDIVLVDSPGTFAIDLSRFDYERLTRPKYPLDPGESIEYPDW